MGCASLGKAAVELVRPTGVYVLGLSHLRAGGREIPIGQPAIVPLSLHHRTEVSDKWGRGPAVVGRGQNQGRVCGSPERLGSSTGAPRDMDQQTALSSAWAEECVVGRAATVGRGERGGGIFGVFVRCWQV